MTVRTYYSTDTGAPVLSGTAGSAIAVLKACLVTGYDVKPGAGWTEEFTGTNLSVLRPSLGLRHYFRFDDSNAQYLMVRGYGTMSAVSTGTRSFPNASTPSDYYCAKSATADTTARAWAVIADEKTAWFYSSYDATAGSANGQMVGFGEFYKNPLIVPDVNSFLWASTVTTLTSHQSLILSHSASISTGLARSCYADGQVGSSMSMGRKTMATGKMEGTHGGVIGGHTTTTTPSPSNGGINVSRIGFTGGAAGNNNEYYSFLGCARGAFDPMHNKPLTHLDTINGGGEFAGKTFQAFNLYQGGQIFFEISNTWDS